MKIRLNEELEKKVVEITGVDYTGELSLENIENMIKDLVCEYHRLEEKLEDKEEYCKEYHVERKIDPYDEYGVSEKDFH